MKLSRWALVAAPLAVGACGGFGSAMTAHTDTVAKAAGKELRVEDAAQLLAANPQIPADPQVVGHLADLWVQYTLLATAFAEDTTLSTLDLDRLIQEQRDEQTLFRFMESSIRPDTAIADADLDELWMTEGPGVEVKARHILFQAGSDATAEQRQQARGRAEAAQRRAAGGENFVTLAEELTEEPGGKERGGDLGWFGRGRMVPQFEEAAFALRTDQVSGVVETPFGYHVVKVEDRRQQPLGEHRELFRSQLVMQRRQQAVTNYLDSIRSANAIQVQEGSVELLREYAGEATPNVRGRAASRELVTYTGGAVTAGEIAELIRSISPQDRQAMREQARADELERFLEEQALREILLDQAGQTTQLSEAAVDSIRSDVRQGIRDFLQMAGFAGRTFPSGKAGDGAIQEAVRGLMEQAVQGQRPIRPLGPLAPLLTSKYPWEVNNASFQRVADRMASIRASQPQQQLPAFPQGPPPSAPPPGEESHEGHDH